MKKLLTFLILTFIIMPVFALPGFKPYLPDNSGDYVYYKDNSFARESYVGFLRYDESTYQLRYYAPVDKTALLPEKNIAILFTVNPDSDFLDLTGERILSSIMPETEDVELVNYLHDLFYELNSRRIKADPVSPENEEYVTSKGFWENGLRISTDYVQFGGNVTLVYDVMIPLFNLKRIVDLEGKDIFNAVTFGTLTSSEDTSFDDFAGKTTKVTKKESGAKLNRKAKACEYSFDEMNISLDANWSQSMENLWLLGDSSLATITTLPAAKVPETYYRYYVLRHMIMSPQNSYADAPNVVINDEGNCYSVTSNIYQYNSDKVVKNVKILKKNEGGKYFLVLFTTYQKDYTANKKYFDDLINRNK